MASFLNANKPAVVTIMTVPPLRVRSSSERLRGWRRVGPVAVHAFLPSRLASHRSGAPWFKLAPTFASSGRPL